MPQKPIKIRIKKLGREKAHGIAYTKDRVIYIDPRLTGAELFETIIHEIMHCQQPDLSEEAVLEYSKEMTELLMKCGYRCVDV